MTARLSGRLRTLERSLLIGEQGYLGPPILILFPDDWPVTDRAAFYGDDPDSKVGAVERNAEAKPGSATRLVVFRVRPDGPR